MLEDAVNVVLDFISGAVTWLFDWFIDFFNDIFTGRSIMSVGNSVINIFLKGSFDFSLKSIFEFLFGISFILFFIRIIIQIIRG